MKRQEKPVGLIKDVGWQFGLSKTFAYPHTYLWDFLFSDKGLKTWLGELEKELEIKKTYKTEEGIEGFVSVFTPYSHIRMKWKRTLGKTYQLFKFGLLVVTKSNY